MKILALFFLITCGSLSASAERIYFNFEDMPRDDQEFHIPVGNNVWIQTRAIHRDATGFYTYASNVYKDENSVQYEKMWRCPYCYSWWPIGKPCSNPECPSKYR